MLEFLEPYKYMLMLIAVNSIVLFIGYMYLRRKPRSV